MTYENAIRLAIAALNSTADNIEQTAKRWPWHKNQQQRAQLQHAAQLKAAAECLQAHMQKPRIIGALFYQAAACIGCTDGRSSCDTRHMS